MDPLTRLDTASAELQAPFALVDIDAFDANAADMARRAGATPIRVASKSIRARVLVERALAREGYAGILAFTLPEALWLWSQGAAEDLVVGYPTVDRPALRRLATDEEAASQIVIMVDDVAQLDLVDMAAPARERAPIRVCLELDASWRPVRGRLHVGARRSPVHHPAEIAALAREVVARPGFELVGVMAYEAQIAGVGDRPPGRRVVAAAIGAMQRRSGAELAERRAAAVTAVSAIAPLRFVNGGGTGSLERTAREPAVTELAAGSGLLAPTLFDAYASFRPQPAALFALPVVRRPGPSATVTVLGGGYVASGAAGRDRLPTPHLPSGLRLDAREGAGEVQTPVVGPAAAHLHVGDRVWFRHAKAGELCERFATLHLLQGDRIVDEVPTYRGEGQTFL